MTMSSATYHLVSFHIFFIHPMYTDNANDAYFENKKKHTLQYSLQNPFNET